jgi:hypothetical protein
VIDEHADDIHIMEYMQLIQEQAIKGKDTDALLVVKVLNQLWPKFLSWRYNLNEDSFIKQHLLLFVESIFQGDDSLQLSW